MFPHHIFQPSFHVQRDEDCNVYVSTINNLIIKDFFSLIDLMCSMIVPHSYPLCKDGWVGEHGSSKSVWPLQTRGKCSVHWDEILSLSFCTIFFQILPLFPSQEPSLQQGMTPCWNLRGGDRLLFVMQIQKFSSHVSSSACKRLRWKIWQIFKIKFSFRTWQSDLLQYSQSRSPFFQPIFPSV